MLCLVILPKACCVRGVTDKNRVALCMTSEWVSKHQVTENVAFLPSFTVTSDDIEATGAICIK